MKDEHEGFGIGNGADDTDGYVEPNRKRRERTIPKYVYANAETGSPRGFRDLHRARVRYALRALQLTRPGCAHSPAYRDLKIALQAVTRAVEETSRAKWGR